MIMTLICVGMGNQMFMYAAGLASASRLNTELVLNNSYFRSYFRTKKGIPYQLSHFPEITERTALLRDVWKLSPGLAVRNVITSRPIRKYHVFRYILLKAIIRLNLAPIDYSNMWNIKYAKHPENIPFPYAYKFSRICNENFAHKDRFREIPDDTLLVGFWESEDYFDGYADDVRKKFRFAEDCFDPALTSRVRQCNSVAVHVRRGDKLREGEKAYSNMSYLRHALEAVSSRTDSPEFFVFSDDITWCKENLHKAHEAKYHFVEGQTAPQDMALMTQCKHVIMGPSTFSWWGAWLNENPRKLIIAPKNHRPNTGWHIRGAVLVD